jgi:hypothetical protein
MRSLMPEEENAGAERQARRAATQAGVAPRA